MKEGSKGRGDHRSGLSPSRQDYDLQIDRTHQIAADEVREANQPLGGDDRIERPTVELNVDRGRGGRTVERGIQRTS